MDDFVPSHSAALQQVTWQGFYCNQAFTGNEIPTPVASAFRIRIAPDAGSSTPFALFFSNASSGSTQVTTVAVADVQHVAQFTRLDAACGIRNSGDPAAHYQLSAALPTPYPVQAGRKYWIAIQALMPDSATVAWYWRIGTPSDGHSLYILDGTIVEFFYDRSFALEGTPSTP